ncbi:unnamed protein product [Clavelina lepadiformis]|uniref:C2H2-type domain-containing protein n=1 Tax=Clavelina lepadiformis TaxID=159417 RepID=A0ABP0F846_CLALP
MRIFKKISAENNHISKTMPKLNYLQDLNKKFSSVHDLISVAATKIHQLEKISYQWKAQPDMYSQDDVESVCTELDYDTDASVSECDDVGSVDGEEQDITPSTKNFVNHVLIKKEGKFHCSECIFQTIHYNIFYSHCKRTHAKQFKGTRKRLVNGEKRKIPHVDHFYSCDVCSFASFSLRGFKTHCGAKHPKTSYEIALKVVSLSEPQAEIRFREFINSLNDGKQRRHAVMQLRYHFLQKDTSNQLKENEEISCMKCSFKTSLPNELEQHYNAAHFTCGPSRDVEDHLFHCEKCSFLNVSYKMLHTHFFVAHGLNNSHATNKTKLFNGDIKRKRANSMDEDDDVDSVKHKKAKVIEKKSDNNDSDDDDDDTCVLKCNRCEFVTEEVCEILNHWRSQHNRVYPDFVDNFINKDFNKNVVLISLPVWMVDSAWMNGWMNKECTNLIKTPLYICDLCDFKSAVLTSVNNHHSTRHENSTCSLSKLDVVESDSNAKKYTHMLCKQTFLFHCYICKNFNSCFFKAMVMHCKQEHEHDVSELTLENLEQHIRKSLSIRCVKCEHVCTNNAEIIKHYQERHSSLLPTFSIIDQGQFTERFRCEFCSMEFESLTHLSYHLKEHQKQHLADFNTQNVQAYSCSKCRRVFRGIRFMRHHFTRLHVEWTKESFSFKDFPQSFFVKKSSVTTKTSEHLLRAPLLSGSKTTGKKVTGPVSQKETELNRKNPVNAIEEIPQPSDASCIYLCPMCSFSTPNAFTLRFHLKGLHKRYFSLQMIEKHKSVRPEEVPITNQHKIIETCSHQTWIDKNQTVYQKHVKFRHNAKHPFKCLHCPRYYICEVVLRMHMRKKHKNVDAPVPDGESKLFFSCTHRNILTRRPDKYKIHVNAKHSDENPYHCPNCNRAYVCGSMFIVHLRKHHQLIINDEILHEYKSKASESLQKVSLKPTVAEASARPGNFKRPLKDYSHPKSVHTKTGDWKCIFCKQDLFSYQILKKHVAKSHPNCQLLRCKWCDYVCKNNVQLCNHGKIHRRFIAGRMKELREIYKDQRLNGLASVNKGKPSTSTNPDQVSKDKGTEDTNSQHEKIGGNDISNASDKPTAKRHYARKTIGSTPKEPQPVPGSNEENFLRRLSQYYKTTHYGMFICKLCSFAATDHTRLLIHMKATHIQGRNYKCKLCFFESSCFKDVQTHLSDHHKMERNHHVAVDVVVKFGPDANEESTNNGRSGKLRRRPYEPEPSLPRVEIEETSDNTSVYFKDLFDPFKKIKPVAVPDSPSQSEQPVKLRITRSNSWDKFQCKYCYADFPSTYDLERHMKRHEGAMIDYARLDEDAMLFSTIGSFMQPSLYLP